MDEIKNEKKKNRKKKEKREHSTSTDTSPPPISNHKKEKKVKGGIVSQPSIPSSESPPNTTNEKPQNNHESTMKKIRVQKSQSLTSVLGRDLIHQQHQRAVLLSNEKQPKKIVILEEIIPTTTNKENSDNFEAKSARFDLQIEDHIINPPATHRHQRNHKSKTNNNGTGSSHHDDDETKKKKKRKKKQSQKQTEITNDNDVILLNNGEDEEGENEEMKKQFRLKEKVEKGVAILKQLDVVSLLGVGCQGQVFLVKTKGTNAYFALKVFKKDAILSNEKTVRSLMTEKRFLSSSSHPFITKLIYSFQSYERLYIMMEFCAGGDLRMFIRKQPSIMNEDLIRFYASEIVSVLDFIHSKGYIYRDLKPENVLLHEDGHIRLADFGLSIQNVDATVEIKMGKKEKKRFGKNKTKGGTTPYLNIVGARAYSLVGSPEYLAPELISYSPHGYDIKVDWWAFGVLLFTMIFGYTPFQGYSLEEIFYRILHVEYAFPDDMSISSSLKSLIKCLLKRDPEKRIGSEEIKSHPFFYGVKWGLLLHRDPPYKPRLSSPSDISNFVISREDEKNSDFEFFSDLNEQQEVSESYFSTFLDFDYESSPFTSKDNINTQNNNPKKRRKRRKSPLQLFPVITKIFCENDQ